MVNLLSGDERRRDCSMSKNDMHITELAHDSLIVPWPVHIWFIAGVEADLFELVYLVVVGIVKSKDIMGKQTIKPMSSDPYNKMAFGWLMFIDTRHMFIAIIWLLLTSNALEVMVDPWLHKHISK
jgi:hypothetical protein